MFGFREIIGISFLTTIVVALLTVVGFFGLPVLLFVGAFYGLAVLFGRSHV